MLLRPISVNLKLSPLGNTVYTISAIVIPVNSSLQPEKHLKVYRILSLNGKTKKEKQQVCTETKSDMVLQTIHRMESYHQGDNI